MVHSGVVQIFKLEAYGPSAQKLSAVQLSCPPLAGDKERTTK